MKHSEIRHVLESRFEKIDEFLDKMIKHFDSEDIHDFRVEIKKVRAFMRLAATRLPGPEELKMPYHIKSLYRHAGIIRNLQLQQHRIFEFIKEKETRQPFQYLKILSNHEEEWKQKIKEIYNLKALKAEEEAIVTTLRFKAGKTTIESYIQNRVEEFKSLMAVREYSDEELHQLRKILKDILYTLPFTGDYFFSFFKCELQTKEDIKSLTDLLGEFQDACISLKLLEPFYTKGINDHEETILLQTIREELTLKKSALRDAIYDKLAQIHPAIPVPE